MRSDSRGHRGSREGDSVGAVEDNVIMKARDLRLGLFWGHTIPKGFGIPAGNTQMIDAAKPVASVACPRSRVRRTRLL